jgi:hypothetical protein
MSNNTSLNFFKSEPRARFRIHKLQTVLLTLIFFSLGPNGLFAQESTTKTPIDMTPLESGTVVNQFDFVLEKSSKFEDTRVVKTFWLTRLKAHVTDSLKTVNRKFSESQKILQKRQFQIDSLKTCISNINTGLISVTNEKDSMKLLGILINKNLYQTIVWIVIIGLLLILIILGILFKRSNSITVQTKTDLEELKLEFETHRKRALDREAQLSRKHLDEILKLKK